MSSGSLGAIPCIVRWRRRPAVSLLALVAIGLLFIQSVFGTLSVYLLPVIRRGLLSSLMTIRGILQDFMSAIGWMLLLAAIFGGRSEPAETQADQK